MSVRFVVGLPGHGKGLFNMHEIARFLGETDRHVVTSVTEIKLPQLTEYLLTRYPGRNLRLNERLHFIEKLQVSEFYRYRGSITLPPAPHLPRDASVKEKDLLLDEYFRPITDGQDNSGGVEYFLTEAHRHFKADTWSAMTDVVMFYMTQHRHFDDNVWVETQLPKQVVVQFRDLCDECIELRNHYKQRMGWFQKPGCFRVNRYYSVPKPGGSAEPFATGKFYLDVKGLANCYRTRGAVATGTGAPETETQKKALPFWTIFAFTGVAIALVMLGLWFLPKVVMGSLGMLLKSTTQATEKSLKDGLGLETAVPGQPQKTSPQEQPASRGASTELVGSGPKGQPTGTTPPPELFVTGITYTGTAVNVLLSDGRVLRERDGVLDHILKRGRTMEFVLVDGTKLLLKPQQKTSQTAGRRDPPKSQ